MLFNILIRCVAFPFSFASLITNTGEDKNTIQWADCAENIPIDVALENDINITSATIPPSILHCGTLVVPMDYQKPMSEQNNITLGLAMYRPPNPKGVLY